MEEWVVVDDLELVNWKGNRVCMTFHHFAYGVDGHCRALVACNLRKQQLQQGEHLAMCCQRWAPVQEKELVALEQVQG